MNWGIDTKSVSKKTVYFHSFTERWYQLCCFFCVWMWMSMSKPHYRLPTVCVLNLNYFMTKLWFQLVTRQIVTPSSSLVPGVRMQLPEAHIIALVLSKLEGLHQPCCSTDVRALKPHSPESRRPIMHLHQVHDNRPPGGNSFMENMLLFVFTQLWKPPQINCTDNIQARVIYVCTTLHIEFIYFSRPSLR